MPTDSNLQLSSGHRPTWCPVAFLATALPPMVAASASQSPTTTRHKVAPKTAVWKFMWLSGCRPRPAKLASGLFPSQPHGIRVIVGEIDTMAVALGTP